LRKKQCGTMQVAAKHEGKERGTERERGRKRKRKKEQVSTGKIREPRPRGASDRTMSCDRT